MIFLPFNVGQMAKAIATPLALPPVSCWCFCKRTKGPSLTRWAFIDKLFTDVLFLVLKRIADGKTESGSLRSTEFKIVADDIHVCFRPDENFIGDIKAHS